ncbi:hypothetical protein Dehly_0254 [Dehalogenimonas lykanthroporepellens BL-DC-9]|nr:hypothetical protein Dehly_0254 [Dehalogenimonas lykanthroporepellens BL-DC-9]
MVEFVLLLLIFAVSLLATPVIRASNQSDDGHDPQGKEVK